jgi:hypothetical protein
MRYRQNKTISSWSYRDSSKRSLENNVISRRGKRKTHTWDRWTCANGKEWSRGTKEVLVIGLHMVRKWVWIFNLEALKFLMHFREPGSSLYFILFYFYTYSYFFFFSLFLVLIFSFFLSFSHFFAFFFLIKFRCWWASRRLNFKIHPTCHPACRLSPELPFGTQVAP